MRPVSSLGLPELATLPCAGKYVLGSSPCAASTCNLTSGAGANYRVTSGTLTLAS